LYVRLWNFRTRVSNFRTRVSNFRTRVSNFRTRVSNFRTRVLNFHTRVWKSVGRRSAVRPAVFADVGRFAGKKGCAGQVGLAARR
jgi:hypothetical protein